VRLKVNLIVTEVTEASLAAQKATSTIPIVIVAVGDPVAAGLVASLARPEANITGLSQNIVETAGKRMEMLRLMVPDLSEVAVLWNPDDNNSGRNWQELQESARRVGLLLKSLEVRSADDIGRALDNESGTRSRALYVAPGPIFVAHLQMIADVAKARRIASIFHLPEFVHVGGLLAYGPDRNDQFRRAAAYVDKILRGAKPSDLPVEQPTKLGLSVNLATARAIGMSVPSLLLAQANEVIE
jgi:putative ABC transport system substrate-binding protein